jgi:MFS family permease
MGGILLDNRNLQRRAIYQGLAFAIFNIFWTASPLVLAQTFGLTQPGIALFALAGAGGALAAPVAGRLGDRGHVWIGTAVALCTITLSFLLAGWAVMAHTLLALALFAIVLDAGTQLNQILGQRVIFGIRPDARGRVNAIYMTIVFVLGAGGSALATVAYHWGGWWGAVIAGVSLGVIALGLFATERPAGGAVK